MPLVSIVPAIISRLSALMGWHHLDSFWPYYSLVVAAFVPWLSVANPLVTIVFVERYRRFMASLLQGNLARIGVASTNSNRNRMMPPETGLQAVRAVAKPNNRSPA